MATPTLKVTYFGMPGRAEPTRLALAVGGIKFEDEKMGPEQWGPLKAKVAPKQLPLLEVDGKLVGQSAAQARYAGKLAIFDGKPLYPQDPLEALLVDEMMDTVGELFGPLGATFAIKDEAEKAAARAALVKEGGDVYKWSAYIDKLLGESSSGFAVGDRFTLADIAIFCWVSLYRCGWLDGCAKDCFDGLKNICAHKTKISAIPQVKEYYKDATGFFAYYQ